MKTFLAILALALFYNSSHSQSIQYKLKENIVYMSKCEHPNKGFKLVGKPVSKAANNDSFLLDIGNKKFTWSDNKGSNTNMIYKFQSKFSETKTQYVFVTEYNSIRITTNQHNEAVVEIIFLGNNQWNCLSYLCATN